MAKSAYYVELELVKTSLQGPKENDEKFKVYKRRWLILGLFILFANANFIQFIEFSIIADVITNYYQVPYSAVDWTTMIAAVTYIIFSMPGSYIVDRIGIRKTFIIGILGTCIGSWIKVGSVHPDRFWLIILGQGIVSTFQICVVPVLPKLAATWFGYNQIATAIGIGCIGAQIGFSLSYIIPPFIVFKGEQAEVEQRLYTLNLIYAVFTTAILPLIILFVKEAPPTPPSAAQQNIIKEKLLGTKGFIETFKSILVIKPYLLYLIIYSVNIGALYPIQILSNEVILQHYPDSSHDVGIIGLLHTIVGFIGSMGIGVFLDKFKKYKIACWSLYFSFLVVLAVYIGTLDQGIVFIYVTSCCSGVLMCAMATLGIDLVVEFTYPAPESVAVGFSYNCSQAASLIFTILFGKIFRSIGILYANLALVILILIADLLFFLMKFDLKKKTIQDTHNKREELIL